MAKSAHPMYVNKRLSAARQLLSLSQAQNESSPLLANILVESAVLQLRLGFTHYINELLETYRRPLINVELTNFAEIVHKEKALVTELQEYARLLDDDSSWLSILNAYSRQLIIEADKSPLLEADEIPKNKHEDDVLRLVDVDLNNSAITHPLSHKLALWLLDQTTEVIQRQREHLIEC